MNKVLYGGVSKTQRQWKLPTALQALFKTIRRDDTPINNSFFTDDELDVLRQAIVNREQDLQTKAWQIAGREKDKGSREISYENYPTMNNDGGYGAVPWLNTFQTLKAYSNKANRPIINAQGTIGSARYTIDPSGYVNLYDTYDFPKNSSMASVPAELFHAYASFLGKPSKVGLQLGNINDWGMGYTGNAWLEPPPKNVALNDYLNKGYEQ